MPLSPPPAFVKESNEWGCSIKALIYVTVAKLLNLLGKLL